MTKKRGLSQKLLLSYSDGLSPHGLSPLVLEQEALGARHLNSSPTQDKALPRAQSHSMARPEVERLPTAEAVLRYLERDRRENSFQCELRRFSRKAGKIISRLLQGKIQSLNDLPRPLGQLSPCCWRFSSWNSFSGYLSEEVLI